jgi:7-carboxy-7-deazaguanine synthase
MPCVFIRLTYCNLRCSYCDTEDSFYEGQDMSIDEIMIKIKNYNCKLIEVTGGEPLLQKESIKLIETLLKNNYKVI